MWAKNVEGQFYFFELCKGRLFNGLRDIYSKYSQSRHQSLVCFLLIVCVLDFVELSSKPPCVQTQSRVLLCVNHPHDRFIHRAVLTS